MIDFLVRPSCFLAVVWCLLLLTRRTGATFRRRLCLSALVGFLGLGLLATLMPGLEIPLPRTSHAVPLLPAAQAAVDAAPEVLAKAGPVAPPAATAAVPVAVAQARTTVPPYLLVWFAGVLVTLAWLVLGLFRLMAITRRASPVVDPAWLAKGAQAAREAGVRRLPRLCWSDHPVPFTCGLFRPCIFLPLAARTWSDERKRMVLLHESRHIEQRDWAWCMLCQITVALHWFNPLVWWMQSRLRREVEASTDAFVVTRNCPADYAETLLEIARGSTGSATPAPALSLLRHSKLHRRITSILSPNPEPRNAMFQHLILLLAIPLTAILHAAEPEDPAIAAGQQALIDVLDGELEDHHRDNNALKGFAIQALLGGDSIKKSPHKKRVVALLQEILADRTPEHYYKGMYVQAYTVYLFAELKGDWVWLKRKHQIDLQAELKPAVALLVKSQNGLGAWRYTPESQDADTSVSGSVFLALIAAHGAGIKVPEDCLRKNLKYLVSKQADDGGFGYTMAVNGNPKLTALGLRGFAGIRKVIKLEKTATGEVPLDGIEKKAVAFLDQEPLPQAKARSGHTAYALWHYASLLEQHPDKERAAEIRQILHGSQQEDGQWVDHPKSRLLSTALSIMTLHELDN